MKKPGYELEYAMFKDSEMQICLGAYFHTYKAAKRKAEALIRAGYEVKIRRSK